MNTITSKRQTITIDYEKNLRKLLGVENLKTSILKKSAGLLKGVLRKSGLDYQREIRKEWEKEIKKLENQVKK